MRRHRTSLLLAFGSLLLLLLYALSEFSAQPVVFAQPTRPTLTSTPPVQPTLTTSPRPTDRPRPEATAAPQPTATPQPSATPEPTVAPTAAPQPTAAPPAQMPATGDPSGAPWLALALGIGAIFLGAGLLRNARSN